MNKLSPVELQRMASTQVNAMHDRCVVLGYAEEEPEDGYGKPIPIYVDYAEVDCGYTPGQSPRQSPREVMGTTDVSMTLPRFRLPLETVIGPKDRIKLTSRFGVALDRPIYHEVVGTPLRGPSALVVNTRVLMTGRPYGG